MRISTKGRYALRILMDVAMNVDINNLRRIHEVAASQNISEKYVGRLIIQLKKAGFLTARRGVNGGYKLARDPSEITLLEILDAMEGKLSIVRCVGAPGPCASNSDCSVRPIWMRLNDQVRSIFEGVTLQMIVDEANASLQS